MGFYDDDIKKCVKKKDKGDFIADINKLIQDHKEIGNIDSAGEVSDGYHTFNELYHHRALLFAALCNMTQNAWKSKHHEDGTMFDGMFIVGMETPEGQATYHYDIDPYWDIFNVPEINKAPEFDGHTPEDAVNRIYKYFTEK